VAGQVYNVGGGAENVISVYAEFFPMLEELLGAKIPVVRDDWRPGDQRVFYADIRSAMKDLDWNPKIGVEEGIKMLFAWVEGNRGVF